MGINIDIYTHTQRQTKRHRNSDQICVPIYIESYDKHMQIVRFVVNQAPQLNSVMK